VTATVLVLVVFARPLIGLLAPGAPRQLSQHGRKRR
jgi:hypothetical protein